MIIKQQQKTTVKRKKTRVLSVLVLVTLYDIIYDLHKKAQLVLRHFLVPRPFFTFTPPHSSCPGYVAK